MQVDRLQLRMRPRSPWEAADLGVRLCQRHWRRLYACHALIALPTLALCLAAGELATWLPATLIFMAKPWLDRTSLFVLSRAAFGQDTYLRDLWSAQRQVWWRQFLLSWTWRRLSPWRSFTQPVYQLEGLPLRERGRRIRQLRGRYRWPAMLVTSAFATCETMLAFGLLALLLWMMPTPGEMSSMQLLIQDFTRLVSTLMPAAYGVVLLFLEPLYVGAGFAMYLNRRAELEAWDIEQELRHAFPA